MIKNSLERIQDPGFHEEPEGFGRVPRLTVSARVIDFLLTHWMAELLLIIILVGGLVLWSNLSGGESGEVEVEEQAAPTVGGARATTLAEILIEGIYYGIDTHEQNGEPVPVTVTRSSNGTDHYLISAQGYVRDFYLDRVTGKLTSQTLGEGHIALNSKTNEIIIEFNGWIFKH